MKEFKLALVLWAWIVFLVVLDPLHQSIENLILSFPFLDGTLFQR